MLKKSGGIMLPDYRYTANIQKSKQHGIAQTQMYCSMLKIESPEANPHTYGQSIYNKGGKNIQLRKDSLFKMCLENCTATCKRMILEHFLSYTKINSKQIKDPCKT